MNHKNLAQQLDRLQIYVTQGKANKARKLLAYQKEKGIIQPVEVISTHGFSIDVINYFQSLKDFGYDITWRVVE